VNLSTHNLQHPNSDLTKYPAVQGSSAYGTNFNMRESNGTKSNEERGINAGTNDRKVRMHELFKSKHEKKSSVNRGLVSGLTVPAANNSAYTRAEKMLQFQQQTSESLLSSGQVDAYSGYRKVFIMPAPRSKNKQKSTDYDAQASGPAVEEGPLNRSLQIAEILADKQNASRVVDNVMNFFRYKDTETQGQQPQTLVLQSLDPQKTYNDAYAIKFLQTDVESRRQSSSKLFEPAGSNSNGSHLRKASRHAQGAVMSHTGGFKHPALQELKVNGASQAIGRRANGVVTNPSAKTRQITKKGSLVSSTAALNTDNKLRQESLTPIAKAI